jgi:Flp pilus assembly protein TadB
MDGERTTPDVLGELRIPTAAAITKQIVERMQREQAERIARSLEITESIDEATRRKAEREAEMRDAILETRDELRWLNAKSDDLAIRQKRTDRRLVFLGAATAVLALIVVALTVALLVHALSGEPRPSGIV